jgi:hypothetical protein
VVERKTEYKMERIYQVTKILEKGELDVVTGLAAVEYNFRTSEIGNYSLIRNLPKKGKGAQSELQSELPGCEPMPENLDDVIESASVVPAILLYGSRSMAMIYQPHQVYVLAKVKEIKRLK